MVLLCVSGVIIAHESKLFVYKLLTALKSGYFILYFHYCYLKHRYEVTGILGVIFDEEKMGSSGKKDGRPLFKNSCVQFGRREG